MIRLSCPMLAPGLLKTNAELHMRESGSERLLPDLGRAHASRKKVDDADDGLDSYQDEGCWKAHHALSIFLESR